MGKRIVRVNKENSGRGINHFLIDCTIILMKEDIQRLPIHYVMGLKKDWKTSDASDNNFRYCDSARP